MTKEIVRELVDGEWVTGVRDASSGGGGGMFPNGAVDASWDGSPVTALDGQLVSVDANGGAVTVTLPSDPPQGSVVGVQLVTDPNGNTVTVDGNGDAIQGSSTYDLPSLGQYETALFTYATGITEAWTVFVKPTAGGGSQSGAEEINATDHLTVANGDQELVHWDANGGGDDLLDLSVPTAPTVLVDGLYTVAVLVQVSGSLTAGGRAVITVALDTDDVDANVQQEIVAPGAIATATLCFFIPAGGGIQAFVQNLDGVASRDFVTNCYVGKA
jgi:hypothetical protein